MTRSREPLASLAGLGMALILVASTGCVISNTGDPQAVRTEAHYQALCHQYRTGDHGSVLANLLPYFQQRTGQMTVVELKQLLGEPRIVTPKSCWYRDALSSVYGWGHIDDPVSDHPEGKHDRVLVYCETGPPDHWIPDESYSLWFVTKDEVFIGVWLLAP